MATGIGTTAQVQSSTTDSQVLIQGALGLSTSTSGKKKQRIIDSLAADQKSKEVQLEQIKDLVLLIDIDLDMYDELIVNIDKQIPSLIKEINDATDEVDAAYEARIAQDVRSELKWVVTGQTKNFTKGGANNTTTTTWQVVKNNTKQTINKYAAKYYKTPKDRDYGGSAVRDINDAKIGFESTILQSNRSAKDGNGKFLDHIDIEIGDTITDSIENPQIFTVGNLPEVVGFGTTSVLGIKTTFGGNIAFGSTVIAYAGINTTAGIAVGDPISLTNVIQDDTVVVGIATTTTNLVGENTLGVTTSVEVDTTAVIISKTAVGATDNAIFNVGIFTDFPTFTLSDQAASGTDSDNFHVLRFTNDAEIGPDFDVTRGGENPVEVGIIEDANKTGYGRSIYLVNNGDPTGTKSFTEFVDPEPKVGGGFVSYYVGNFEWPIKAIPQGVNQNTGQPSYWTYEYQDLGSTLVVVTGAGATTPSAGAGTTDAGELNPSQSVKDAADALIATKEAALASIKAKNLPKINDLIAKSKALRRIRDDKQSQAWNYRRGQGDLANKIKQSKKDQKDLTKTDLDEFE
tara:strand:+ start:955 stop:2670 length:1716 start_codon:yes stop_codon:yes gene_type:complete